MNRLFKDSPEYRAISEFYGDAVAKRSGVKLMRHIDEGAAIIDALELSLPDGNGKMTKRFEEGPAIRAYYLHPLFQADTELMTVGRTYAEGLVQRLGTTPPLTVMLTMEYRTRANAWLSEKIITTGHEDGHFGPVYTKNGEPDMGVIPEVHAMLIADKVQNYKDFLLYHAETHPRRHELDLYFKTWLAHLGVSETHFKLLVKRAEATLS